MSFSDKAISFFSHYDNFQNTLHGFSVLNPYKNDQVKDIIRSFFTRYYNDDRKRVFVMGINPGRFGGGLTGVSFTDPVALRVLCGVSNNLGTRQELSSKFIYKAIERFGGVDNFFSSFYLSALYPLALVDNGRNINYYDSKLIYNLLKDEIKDSVRSQINFGAYKQIVICLGKKNAVYLSEINNELNYFEKIIVLEHPRYIMQYKMKKIDEYLDSYINSFNYCFNAVSR